MNEKIIIGKENVMENLKGVPPKRVIDQSVSRDVIREPYAYYEVPIEDETVMKISLGCPPGGGGDAV